MGDVLIGTSASIFNMTSENVPPQVDVDYYMIVDHLTNRTA